MEIDEKKLRPQRVIAQVARAAEQQIRDSAVAASLAVGNPETKTDTGLKARAADEEFGERRPSTVLSNLPDPILTAVEVAVELRCCKAQVHRLMNGTVKGISKLPSIALGRKRVIRRSSFENWKRQNESGVRE